MSSIFVTLSPELTQTRLLMVSEGRDVLKAVLPAAAGAHPQAARTLLEGLALWHNHPLSFVLCVDEQASLSDGLGLYDALGYGARQLHFEVAVAHRDPRVRSRRLSGMGRFSDLRQVQLEVAHG